MTDPNQKIKLTGLWANQMKSGQTYFTGTLGSARVVIFPNSYKEKDNDPDYNLFVQPKQNKDSRGSSDNSYSSDVPF